ncbi:hypothetical protein ACIP9H_33745 [Streptomyces sp. NPDC088732]|uniref:hypothetical protein n=1 Tax=Streptomyces sp. NPDC088732 TaxID=3365879 RepID=UPI003812BC8B
MSTDSERWDIGQVAAYLGIKVPSAHGQLSRMGIKRIGVDDTGPRIRALYDADEVRAAHAARPGRGARTDLAGHDSC